MKLNRIIIVIVVVLIFGIFSSIVKAQNNSQAEDLEKKIKDYQNKLSELGQQRNSLSSQIQYMDTQIYLTNLKIQDTEQKIASTGKEIDLLGSRIQGLDQSLDYISKLLLDKIIQSYKQREVSLFGLLFDSQNADDLLTKIKYVKIARDNNQKLLVQVQEAKSNFEEQKSLREEKKQELDNLVSQLDRQKVDLDSQKSDRQRLLVETQNSERGYQDLLAQAQAEYAAIQGIVAGAGTEVQMREVKKGDSIASIIPGKSCNSSGSHLHFIVQEGGAVRDPFGYLKSIDNVNDSGGDNWNPSGSWDWPLSPTIYLHQGYGVTWFVRTYGWYSFHNGIDISGASYSVNAVSDGTLYKGSYALGCTLSYVKLAHKDSNMSTLYLHVYPQ